MIKTVVISIGNSDDKLILKTWSAFCLRCDHIVRLFAKNVHFYGFSLPNSQYQTATWLIEFDTETGNEKDFKDRLTKLGKEFYQDSIFWLSGIGEFLC